MLERLPWNEVEMAIEKVPMQSWELGKNGTVILF